MKEMGVVKISWRRKWQPTPEKPGKLLSMGLQRVRHDFVTKEEQQTFSRTIIKYAQLTLA